MIPVWMICMWTGTGLYCLDAHIRLKNVYKAIKSLPPPPPCCCQRDSDPEYDDYDERVYKRAYTPPEYVGERPEDSNTDKVAESDYYYHEVRLYKKSENVYTRNTTLQATRRVRP